MKEIPSQSKQRVGCSRSFHAYYNDTKRTSSAFTDDGWYKTDDIEKITATGEIHVEGRKTNVVISGGMNCSVGNISV